MENCIAVQARTVEVTYLLPNSIASSIAHAYRSTRPARQIELMALPEQTIVPREQARMRRVDPFNTDPLAPT
jgi:hypothetical protein